MQLIFLMELWKVPMTSDEKQHYLLDTNIVSELTRYNADHNMINKMSEHCSDMAISVLNYMELLMGIELLQKGLKKSALTDFIHNDVVENFPIIPYTKEAAQIHAKILATLQTIGKKCPYDDSFIASIALAEDMILVTRNTKHFESIAEHFGLKTENWFE